MADVLEMITSLEKFDVKASVKKVFADNTEQIKTLIQAQMYAGKRGDGKRISNKRTGKGYASNEYAMMKQSMNPVPGLGVPDLYLTGSFYSRMKTKLVQEDIETDSDDPKSEDLLTKYGEEVFLIAGDSIENFNESIFLPDFEIEINKQTGLQFN